MLPKNARPLLSQLSIPAPIKKYFSVKDWEIDLSNNTNPYIGNFAEYPDVCQDHLKEIYLSTLLSLKPSPQHKPRLSKDHILFTVGSMEGLDLILRTFAEPNTDIICLPRPTFSAYEHWALLHNLKIVDVPLEGEQLNQLSIEVIQEINPKIVFLCDPNNPVGSKLESSIIPELCESIGGFVIVDEAYIEFSDHPSSLYYLNSYKNLIILRTFSKAWGMAGIRCGAILADKPIINALRYVQLPFGLSTLTQIVLKESLLYPDAIFDSWDRIRKNRDNLRDELLKCKIVKKVFRSETNFIMPVFHESTHIKELFKVHKIHVLDCSSSIPDSFRVSIGTEQQNLKFLEVIQLASLS
jgi:histidinol-phosphate aminotransferase